MEQVLKVAKEQMERKNSLISKGYNRNRIAERVCSVMALEVSEIWKSGKSRRRVAARSLLGESLGTPHIFIVYRVRDV